MATLSQEDYWDKVYACWMGKNCGGTLGTPLEQIYGQEEPFAIDWYPELREGGIPNDDLEMQLIWLKAIEEQGFALDARMLAQYWLDYIGYNWDEYGLNKTNLRLGLVPPVSGYFNNWFRDCMGSPIRSEIWACLAPGHPNLAVRYAYEDASVDHAGGEGLWGEVFNAALQSAAFVESDPQTLLDIALSYLPPTSGIFTAIQTVRQAYRDGLSWQEARRHVLLATPHYNAQYAPLNLGFQTIGWLYGKDFGDALCTAVNCGYDTDCTGATLGALLGILDGCAGLPPRWTEPLGESIATNESWGGLRHASEGANPVPTNLRELTDRVCRQGRRLLAWQDAPLQIAATTDLQGLLRDDLYASQQTQDALQRSPLHLSYQLTNFTVDICYHEAPVIQLDIPYAVEVHLHNPHPTDLVVEMSLGLPEGWTVSGSADAPLRLTAHSSAQRTYRIQTMDPACIHNSNTLELRVHPQQRPMEPTLPIVLLGARRWQLWQESTGEKDADRRLDQAGLPEREPMGCTSYQPASAVNWVEHVAVDNELPTSIDTHWVGTLYARLYLWNPEERDIRLGIPATCPRKLWVNGRLIHQTKERSLLRPNYGGDSASYGNAWLKQGWNEVLIKYTRDAHDPAFAAHFTMATPGLFHGIADVEWTCLPWERENAQGSSASVLSSE